MVNFLVRLFLKLFAISIAVLFFASCSNGESLQKYFVENSGETDFISIDLPTSLLNISESELSEEQKEAYESIRKMNVLAFKLDDDNKEKYEAERSRVKNILNQPKYEELMKVTSGNIRATVKYLGDDDDIDEVIVFGSDKDKGFALVRVLGKDMKPENIAQLISAIQTSKLDGGTAEQLKGLFSR